MVEQPSVLIDFLVEALYAEILDQSFNNEGIAVNTILKIGNTCFMIGFSGNGFQTKSSFYLYVNDVDKLHQHAISCGAKELFPPKDMDYEDRQSGIEDLSGNAWWISTRLVEANYHE